MSATAPSRLVFKRTWSYRWIGVPVCLFTAVWLINKMVQDGFKDGFFISAMIVGCVSIAMGLWLPSRLAVLPLRVLGALMSVAMVFVFTEAWAKNGPTLGHGGWQAVWRTIESTRGLVLLGFPGMWFALTGKVGWREDQRPIIV